MMENVTETNTVQDNNPAGTPEASLGKMLSEARERLGLSVMDVSSQIKFAPRQIEALEADDFRHLPETAFLRGFVRSYAKILRLDAEILLAALPQSKAAAAELTPDSVDEPFPDIHSLLRHNLIWLAAALLLILGVAGFALWHFTTPPEPIKAAQVESPVPLPAEAAVNPVPPVQEPVESEPASQKMPATKMPATKMPLPKMLAPAALAQSSVPAASTALPRPAKKKPAKTSDTQPENQPVAQSGVQPGALSGVQSGVQPDTSSPITSLRMEFTEEAWAEIRDKNGKILSSRVHPAGSEMSVNGRAPFSLLIGRALSVRLYYLGKQIDLAPHTRRSTEVASLTLE